MHDALYAVVATMQLLFLEYVNMYIVFFLSNGRQMSTLFNLKHFSQWTVVFKNKSKFLSKSYCQFGNCTPTNKIVFCVYVSLQVSTASMTL